MSARSLRIALSVAVGLVLADSSIVVLALPDIYRELDVSVSAVVWVLISFNLTLALAAVPAAMATARVGAARLTAAGLLVFAGASLLCDRLLLMGFMDEKHAFTGQDVGEVIAELNQEFTPASARAD